MHTRSGKSSHYAWAFGDGATGSGATVTHSYPNAGSYTAVVTAANSVSVVTATTTVEVTPAFVQTTRTITYTYDGLHRLTAADYSTGESYAYEYDAVGNRVAYTVTHGVTNTTGTTTYTYDAANRLTSIELPDSSVQTYTWDARGNLLSTGAFTYTYNAAGRMVRAESVDLTSVYTYTADGLRVQQAVDGAVTSFAWDWATGVPELLTDGNKLYLVGHDTLGWEDTAGWTYAVPDALGSVRQVTDGDGAVVDAREWTPYGVEVGNAQAGLGYTGEWWDAAVGLQYLRARWYDSQSGRFTQVDPAPGDRWIPSTLVQNFAYGRGDPVNWLDPTGLTEQWWEDMLRNAHWRQVLLDSARRHNRYGVTGIEDDVFASTLASVILIEAGNLGGASDGVKGAIGDFVGPLPEEIRMPIVIAGKWLEILYNKWLGTSLPCLYPNTSFLQYLARNKIGYQTEGIVNIDHDVKSQAEHYGVDVHSYPLVQFNSDDEYHRADGTFDHSRYLQGQEQWVEYLAASFEVVQKRAQELGADLTTKRAGEEWPESVRAFSQWHKSGIVEAFSVERYGVGLGAWYGEGLLQASDDPVWAAIHRTAKEEANNYYMFGVKEHLWSAMTGLAAPLRTP